jgi:uncharacterized OB-fold protein
MKQWIDSATLRAIRFNGDEATRTFFDALRERRFQSTRCEPCETTVYPPRAFCPACGSEEVAWVDMPREGTLHAFSQQHRGLRFFTPDVLGLVELPGCEVSSGPSMDEVGEPRSQGVLMLPMPRKPHR